MALQVDTLDKIQAGERDRLGNLRATEIKQEDSLSSIIKNVNVKLTDSRAKFQHSTAIYKGALSDAGAQSDEIKTRILKAREDPLHDFFAFFTDEESVQEMIIDHNALQNEQNAATRLYAQAQQEYRVNLTNIKANVKFAQDKLQLTKEAIQSTGAFASTVVAEANAQIAADTQKTGQLNLDQVNAAISDPNTPIGLSGKLQDRKIALEKGLAVFRTESNKAGKSQLQLANEAANFVETHFNAIADGTIQGVLKDGKTRVDKETGVPLTFELAQTAKRKKDETAKAEVQTAVSMATDNIMLQGANLNIEATAGRAATAGGYSGLLYTENENGVRGVAPGVPLDIAKQLHIQLGFQATIQAVDAALQNDPANEKLQLERAGLVKAAVANKAKVENLMAEKVESNYEDPQAKIAGRQWVIEKHMSNANGTAALLGEELQSFIPVSSGKAFYGDGYGQGVKLLSDLLQADILKDHGDDKDLFNEDGEVDTNKLIAAAVSKKFGKESLQQRLSRVITANPEIKNTIVRGFQPPAMLILIKSIAADHQNEPATLAMLQGMTNLSPGKLHIMDATSIRPDLLQNDSIDMYKMVNMELMRSGAKISNAGHDLTSLVDEFHKRALEPQFRATGMMQSLLTSDKHPAAGAIEFLALHNNADQAFRAVWNDAWANLPGRAELAVAMQAAKEEKQNEVDRINSTNPRNRIAVKHQSEQRAVEAENATTQKRTDRLQNIINDFNSLDSGK